MPSLRARPRFPTHRPTVGRSWTQEILLCTPGSFSLDHRRARMNVTSHLGLSRFPGSNVVAVNAAVQRVGANVGNLAVAVVMAHRHDK